VTTLLVIALLHGAATAELNVTAPFNGAAAPFNGAADWRTAKSADD